MIKHVMDREYDFDSLGDVEEDVSWYIGETQVAKDEHGVFKGSFRITITYEEGDEQFI